MVLLPIYDENGKYIIGLTISNYSTNAYPFLRYPCGLADDSL